MARRTQVILVDDIDGGDASSAIEFGLDGVSYEIDLNEENAQKLRDLIEPWRVAGRRTGGRAKRGRRPANSGQTPVIRQWAQANGYELGDRGRIPQNIKDAFTAAH